MTPQPSLTPTQAQVAEARSLVSVALARADDVLHRPLARRAAWNVLRADLAGRKSTAYPHASGCQS